MVILDNQNRTLVARFDSVSRAEMALCLAYLPDREILLPLL